VVVERRGHAAAHERFEMMGRRLDEHRRCAQVVAEDR
jgi:hypothetical protein